MRVLDPVCEMKFVRDKAVAKLEYHGKTYYFCSEGCRKQFEENPDTYMRK